MKELKLLSPAKINLFLEVLSPREDGYHEIETLLQAIDIHDEVTLKDRKEGIKIVCSKKGVPQGKGNLAYQAAEIILQETHLERGVEIEIKKKIPLAAGLGGGSSNAAAVLVGLKKLWNLNSLSGKKLHYLAKKLGMDIPFFIEGGRALGRGRGEELTLLKGWKPFWLTLVVPGFPISTAWVYQSLRGLTRETKRIRMPPDTFKTWPKKKGNPALCNRLEEVTEKAFPWVKRTKEKLRELGGAVLMSGSGPAVFGIFPEKHCALEAGTIIKEELVGLPGAGKEEVYVVKTFGGGVSIVQEKLKV